jgi:uncharacterized membrane protein
MRRYAFTDFAAPDDVVVSPEARRWAKAMLFFWGLAVLGGRLTAYATHIRIQSAAAVAIAVVLLLLLARFLVEHARRGLSTRRAVATGQTINAR